MREHIDEIEHHHIEVVALQLVELADEAVGILRGIDLMVGEGVATTIALQLCLDEGLFVEVLALLFVLVDPEVWEHLLYLLGHQA